MIKRIIAAAILFLAFGCQGAFATLYDNTTSDTLNTLFYSVGPYSGIGDQIELASDRRAASAELQFFNAAAPGEFNAQLRFYEVGSPVGVQLGQTFSVPGVASAGSDIINVIFDLGALALPQNVVFIASVSGASDGMDLGVNLFEPPAVGSSDNTFLIVDAGGFSHEVSSNNNVYFRLLEVPEPSVVSLSALGLGALAVWRGMRRVRRR
jgi:hypothetical protein